jgi:KUP system potassium uptake protein
MSANTTSPDKKTSLAVLSVGALGVVFGDIGTSPLYAIKECFAHGLTLEPANILGVLSLIFWGLVVIVSIKYLFIVMRADNKGEGGILALTSLAINSARRHGLQVGAITIIGLCGAALFIGDSALTPAISVLSAVEGIAIIENSLSAYVLPLAVLILVLLFMFQKHGTALVGKLFGPVMIVWFVTIGMLGLNAILRQPDVLQALNPMWGLVLIKEHSWLSFAVLGAVLLAFTGAEALYADLGHFGLKAIRIAWFFAAMPGLVLNYFGQGALLLTDPSAASNPFYLLAPKELLVPFIVLATLATVIASQAVITGAFSIVQQAMQLDFLPRFNVRHTSATEVGQIYIPEINWVLCFCVLVLVFLFRDSNALANAYGFAVVGTMLCTTLLVYTVVRHQWNWLIVPALVLIAPFLAIDAAMFITVLLKVPHGGWVALLTGVIAFVVFITWRQGRDVVRTYRRTISRRLDAFIHDLRPDHPVRVPGTAVYMSSLKGVVPQALMSNLQHNKVLHERVFILTIITEEDPRVPEEGRAIIKPLDQGFWQITLHYGFMETPNIRRDLDTYLLADCPMQLTETSFFIGRDIYVGGAHSLKPVWRNQLFLWLSNNATAAMNYFNIPASRVVEVGIQIEV